ncbi:hypothetical protein PT300_12415 [Enterobacteriaceae bacterium ESL0689]|nr:hypothetical protein [Enterobacteriaceae bacterium ESL0689]
MNERAALVCRHNTPHPDADFPSWDDVLITIGVRQPQESGLHINSTQS